MTLEEAHLIARWASIHGSSERRAVYNEAREILRKEANRLLDAEVAKRYQPPQITDIQVYSDTCPGYSWVAYTWLDRKPAKFKMPNHEAGAIKVAWEAGKRVGAQNVTQPRDEDDI